MSRVYVGRLPDRCSERDIERFFKGYGRLRDIVLKSGYAFVEFENGRDAEDAVYDLHGKDMRGDRVVVEHARVPYGGRDRGGHRGHDFHGGGRKMNNNRDSRYDPPTRTDHRAVIKNLSSRVSWQDLKDLMRKAGEVTYADAHKVVQNEGIVEFASARDLRAAIEKFDGYDLHGRHIKVTEEKYKRRDSFRGRSRSRSCRSISRSRSRSRTRSRTRSKSPIKRGRSGSSHEDEPRTKRRMGSSKSRSVSRNSRRRSHSGRSNNSKQNGASRSPSKHDNLEVREEHSRSPSKGRSPTPRSRSPSRSRSRSESKGPSRSPSDGRSDRNSESEHEDN